MLQAARALTRKSWHWVRANSDAALCALIFAIAIWLTTREGRADDQVARATLAGALVGSGAILLGSWINRAHENRRKAENLLNRRSRFDAVLRAELVDVAAGLMGADDYLSDALEAVKSGASAPLDLGDLGPRDMPFTFTLCSELWVLEPLAVDAIVVLRSNLTVTRRSFELVPKDKNTNRFEIVSLLRVLRHTMGVLADCFELLFPEFKLSLPKSPPSQLASTVLRRPAPNL
jgi:hypothetical protein